LRFRTTRQPAAPHSMSRGSRVDEPRARCRDRPLPLQSLRRAALRRPASSTASAEVSGCVLTRPPCAARSSTADAVEGAVRTRAPVPVGERVSASPSWEAPRRAGRRVPACRRHAPLVGAQTRLVEGETPLRRAHAGCVRRSSALLAPPARQGRRSCSAGSSRCTPRASARWRRGRWGRVSGGVPAPEPVDRAAHRRPVRRRLKRPEGSLELRGIRDEGPFELVQGLVQLA
jgi:hypothetical protein